MAKLIAALIIGLGVGAGTVLFVSGLSGEGESTSPVPRSLETSSNALTTTRTPASRPQVRSLADIQALPSEFERNAALYARVQSADVDAVEILLDEAEGLTNPERVKQVIYSRYVQLDPRAALNRLRDEDRDQTALIPATVRAAAGLDLDAALAFVDTLDGALKEQSAREILGLDGLSDARKREVAKRFALEPYLWQLQARSQAKHDPAGAWQAALAMDKSDERRTTLRSVAEKWIETDPLAALSAVASIDGADRRRLQDRLVRHWASQDPDAALVWALGQPGSPNTDPLRQVAEVVANHSPREVFELVEKLEPPRRNRIAQGVLFAWGRTDPVAALDALATMANAGRLGRPVGVSIIGSWASNDPEAAIDWVRAQEPSPIHTSMLTSAMSYLGRSDPLRALSLADELDGTVRSKAIERVLHAWGRKDPRAAAAWLDASGDKTPSAVRTVARHFAEEDPEGAFEWLQDQSVEARRRAFPTVVGRLAAESPDSALRLVDGIEDTDVKQAAGFELMSTWVEFDPQAAIRAITRMDDSVSRHLYQSAFQMWSHFDPESATGFLDQIPSSHRDGATLGIVQQVAFEDDLDLAERLFDHLKGDEVRRRRGEPYCSVALREVDPERAERYRELSDVTGWQRIDIHL